MEAYYGKLSRVYAQDFKFPMGVDPDAMGSYLMIVKARDGETVAYDSFRLSVLGYKHPISKDSKVFRCDLTADVVAGHLVQADIHHHCAECLQPITKIVDVWVHDNCQPKHAAREPINCQLVVDGEMRPECHTETAARTIAEMRPECHTTILKIVADYPRQKHCRVAIHNAEFFFGPSVNRLKIDECLFGKLGDRQFRVIRVSKNQCRIVKLPTGDEYARDA